jgi:predicted nucleic acid-binding Zn ribbon protein
MPRCEKCDALLPPDRDHRARFCSDRCKRQFNYERERAQSRKGKRRLRAAISRLTAADG